MGASVFPVAFLGLFAMRPAAPPVLNGRVT
jgi:hypothetical protein